MVVALYLHDNCVLYIVEPVNLVLTHQLEFVPIGYNNVKREFLFIPPLPISRNKYASDDVLRLTLRDVDIKDNAIKIPGHKMPGALRKILANITKSWQQFISGVPVTEDRPLNAHIAQKLRSATLLKAIQSHNILVSDMLSMPATGYHFLTDKLLQTSLKPPGWLATEFKFPGLSLVNRKKEEAHPSKAKKPKVAVANNAINKLRINLSTQARNTKSGSKGGPPPPRPPPPQPPPAAAPPPAMPAPQPPLPPPPPPPRPPRRRRIVDDDNNLLPPNALPDARNVGVQAGPVPGASAQVGHSPADSGFSEVSEGPGDRPSLRPRRRPLQQQLEEMDWQSRLPAPPTWPMPGDVDQILSNLPQPPPSPPAPGIRMTTGHAEPEPDRFAYNVSNWPPPSPPPMGETITSSTVNAENNTLRRLAELKAQLPPPPPPPPPGVANAVPPREPIAPALALELKTTLDELSTQAAKVPTILQPKPVLDIVDRYNQLRGFSTASILSDPDMMAMLDNYTAELVKTAPPYPYFRGGPPVPTHLTDEQIASRSASLMNQATQADIDEMQAVETPTMARIRNLEAQNAEMSERFQLYFNRFHDMITNPSTSGLDSLRRDVAAQREIIARYFDQVAEWMKINGEALSVQETNYSSLRSALTQFQTDLAEGRWPTSPYLQGFARDYAALKNELMTIKMEALKNANDIPSLRLEYKELQRQLHASQKQYQEIQANLPNILAQHELAIKEQLENTMTGVQADIARAQSIADDLVERMAAPPNPNNDREFVQEEVNKLRAEMLLLMEQVENMDVSIPPERQKEIQAVEQELANTRRESGQTTALPTPELVQEIIQTTNEEIQTAPDAFQRAMLKEMRFFKELLEEKMATMEQRGAAMINNIQNELKSVEPLDQELMNAAVNDVSALYQSIAGIQREIQVQEAQMQTVLDTISQLTASVNANTEKYNEAVNSVEDVRRSITTQAAQLATLGHVVAPPTSNLTEEHVRNMILQALGNNSVYSQESIQALGNNIISLLRILKRSQRAAAATRNMIVPVNASDAYVTEKLETQTVINREMKNVETQVSELDDSLVSPTQRQELLAEVALNQVVNNNVALVQAALANNTSTRPNIEVEPVLVSLAQQNQQLFSKTTQTLSKLYQRQYLSKGKTALAQSTRKRKAAEPSPLNAPVTNEPVPVEPPDITAAKRIVPSYETPPAPVAPPPPPAEPVLPEAPTTAVDYSTPVYNPLTTDPYAYIEDEITQPEYQLVGPEYEDIRQSQQQPEEPQAVGEGGGVISIPIRAKNTPFGGDIGDPGTMMYNLYRDNPAYAMNFASSPMSNLLQDTWHRVNNTKFDDGGAVERPREGQYWARRNTSKPRIVRPAIFGPAQLKTRRAIEEPLRGSGVVRGRGRFVHTGDFARPNRISRFKFHYAMPTSNIEEPIRGSGIEDYTAAKDLAKNLIGYQPAEDLFSKVYTPAAFEDPLYANHASLQHTSEEMPIYDFISNPGNIFAASKEKNVPLLMTSLKTAYPDLSLVKRTNLAQFLLHADIQDPWDLQFGLDIYRRAPAIVPAKVEAPYSKAVYNQVYNELPHTWQPIFDRIIQRGGDFNATHDEKCDLMPHVRPRLWAELNNHDMRPIIEAVMPVYKRALTSGAGIKEAISAGLMGPMGLPAPLGPIAWVANIIKSLGESGKNTKSVLEHLQTKVAPVIQKGLEKARGGAFQDTVGTNLEWGDLTSQIANSFKKLFGGGTAEDDELSDRLMHFLTQSGGAAPPIHIGTNSEFADTTNYIWSSIKKLFGGGAANLIEGLASALPSFSKSLGNDNNVRAVKLLNLATGGNNAISYEQSLWKDPSLHLLYKTWPVINHGGAAASNHLPHWRFFARYAPDSKSVFSDDIFNSIRYEVPHHLRNSLAFFLDTPSHKLKNNALYAHSLPNQTRPADIIRAFEHFCCK